MSLSWGTSARCLNLLQPRTGAAVHTTSAGDGPLGQLDVGQGQCSVCPWPTSHLPFRAFLPCCNSPLLCPAPIVYLVSFPQFQQPSPSLRRCFSLLSHLSGDAVIVGCLSFGWLSLLFLCPNQYVPQRLWFQYDNYLFLEYFKIEN